MPFSLLSWTVLGRLVVKSVLLFILFNLLFALWMPLENLGQLTLYHTIFPGRPRLPYGENPAAYNLSLNNMPALFRSHLIHQPPAPDEYRVVLIGDSNTWGWLLRPEETLAAQLNQQNLIINGRSAHFYNLGYPIMSLTKDLLVLDEALQYQPDLIIWLITLESFVPEKQLVHPLVQNNAHRLRPLITRYHLTSLDPAAEQWVDPTFWQKTIVGQRRPLADLLRLQLFGLSWAATGIDQNYPADFTPRQADFDEDINWYTLTESTPLTPAALAFDVLTAGVAHTQETPVLLVNEPMFVSTGRNSDLRYNSFYPRWIYDQYRPLLAGQAHQNQWHYVDAWDVISPEEFTDTPVHLSPAGTQQFATWLAQYLDPLPTPEP
jgi:lysophospholipase L1-like esterase